MRKKRGFIDIQNMKPRFTFIFKKKRNYKHYSTSSIFRNFQPSNCMIILCNWVPWRSASTLGAAAYRLICSSASFHCFSPLVSL